MTPFYEEDGICIYHGDCREVLPSLAFDVVFTSPPYNLGRVSGAYANDVNAYLSYVDSMTEGQYADWQSSVLAQMWAQLPKHGAIFYNHKVVIRDGVALLPTRLVPTTVTLRQIVLWDRGVGFNWSPSHFVPRSEWVLLLARPEFRLADRGSSNAGDVWRVPIEQGDDGHPCAFPTALPATAMMATNPSFVWLDPFMGSGTTLRAAKDLGRKAIGIEIEERYCEIAAKRLRQRVLPLGESA